MERNIDSARKVACSNGTLTAESDASEALVSYISNLRAKTDDLLTLD
jgi:hypothetical protein